MLAPWTATTPPPPSAPPQTRRQPVTRSRGRRSCWAGTRWPTRATTRIYYDDFFTIRRAGSAQGAMRRSVRNSPPTSQAPPTPTPTPTTTTTTGWSPATVQDARPWTATTPPPQTTLQKRHPTRQQISITRLRGQRSCWAGTRWPTRATTRIYYDDFFPSSCRVNSGGRCVVL